MAHRILIVDDNEVLARSLAFILEEEGYSVVPATTGKEGLQHLSSGNKFDLLITDLMMPDVKGMELITLLKKFQSDLPIVAISGSVDDLNRARQQGIKHTIAKPCNRAAVLKTVQSALSEKASPAA